jgi:hypothetical protein
MKAYKVTYKKLPGDVAYYANETASKARYDALLALQDGYTNVQFQDIRVVRAPEFDELAQQAKRAGGIGHLVRKKRQSTGLTK